MKACQAVVEGMLMGGRLARLIAARKKTQQGLAALTEVPDYATQDPETGLILFNTTIHAMGEDAKSESTAESHNSDAYNELKEAIIAQAERRFKGQQLFAEKVGGVDANGNRLPENKLEIYKRELGEFLDRCAENGTLAYHRDHIKEMLKQGKDVETILGSTPNALFSYEQLDIAAVEFGVINKCDTWRRDVDADFLEEDERKIYADKTPEQISGPIFVDENGNVPVNKFTLRTSDFNLPYDIRSKQIEALHKLQEKVPTARGPRDIEQVALWYELKKADEQLVDRNGLTGGRNLDEDTELVTNSGGGIQIASDVFVDSNGKPVLGSSLSIHHECARAVTGDALPTKHIVGDA